MFQRIKQQRIEPITGALLDQTTSAGQLVVNTFEVEPVKEIRNGHLCNVRNWSHRFLCPELVFIKGAEDLDANKQSYKYGRCVEMHNLPQLNFRLQNMARELMESHINGNERAEDETVTKAYNYTITEIKKELSLWRPAGVIEEQFMANEQYRNLMQHRTITVSTQGRRHLFNYFKDGIPRGQYCFVNVCWKVQSSNSDTVTYHLNDVDIQAVPRYFLDYPYPYLECVVSETQVPILAEHNLNITIPKIGKVRAKTLVTQPLFFYIGSVLFNKCPEKRNYVANNDHHQRWDSRGLLELSLLM